MTRPEHFERLLKIEQEWLNRAHELIEETERQKKMSEQETPEPEELKPEEFGDAESEDAVDAEDTVEKTEGEGT